MVNDLLNIFIPHIILILTIIFQMIFGVLKPHSLIFRYKDINVRISNLISIIGLIFALFSEILSSGEYIGFNYSIIVTPDVKFLSILVFLCGISTIFLNTKLLNSNRQCCYKYHILFLTAILGGICALSSNDFLTLFVALETLSFALYFLISFAKGYNSKEAGFKYLVSNAVSMGFLLFGVSYLLGLSSSLNYTEMTQIFETSHSGIIYTISAIMIFVGLAMKLAVFPFANWVIDVYNGSETSIIAFLSTVPKIVVIGVIIRLLNGVLGYSVELNTVILLMGILTAFWANIYALKENNVKKILACSSSANASYMLVIMAITSDFSCAAVVFYILCYVLMNIGALAYLNIVEKTDGQLFLDNLGISNNKLYSLCFIICVLGLAGLPVTSGFPSKIFLVYSLIQSGLIFLPVVFILLLLFTIALYYYIKLARAVLIPLKLKQLFSSKTRANTAVELVLVLMTIITVLIGVMPFNLIARSIVLF